MRALDGCCSRQAVIHGPFDDGRTHGAPRVERAVGVLKNDLHPLAQGSQLRRTHHGDVVSAQHHRAARRVDEAHDATCHGALA